MFSQLASRASLGALLIGLGAAGCTSSPAVGSRSSALGSTSLTISKLYGAGGNTGATYNADFVELFNPSAVPVNVTGWTIQYSAAAKAAWSTVPLVGQIIPPGGYYLVQLATGTNGVAPPATPDTSNTNINMSGTTGKVALVSSTTALTCGLTAGSCTGAAGLVDLVGYGTSATDFETAAAPAPSATTILVRAGNGATDTDNNSTDFSAVLATSVTINHGTPPDMAQPIVDMTEPPDLTPPPDLTGADMTTPPDLYTPPDLTGADMTPPPDMTTIPPDMTLGPDMTVVSTDMASSATGVGDVVISQLYGAGGNTGATYTNDYVELFNRGKATVQLGNWSVQYASKANAFSQVAVLPPGASIAPGQYFLVQVAGGSVGTALPTADFVSTSTSFNLSASGGKVALVDEPNVLTCGTAATRCTGTATLSDFVGYGTGANAASDYEGSGPAPTPGAATNALFRAGGGCVDTQDNAADFSSAAAMPRNSATAAVDCSALPIADMSASSDDASVSQDLGHAGGGGTAGGGGSAGGGTSSGGGGGGTHVSGGGGGGCSVAANGSSDAGAPIVLLLAAGVLWFRRRVRLG
jgi:hypothetical protein